MIRLGARRGGQKSSKKKSKLQPFPKQGKTSNCEAARAPLTKHSNEVGGGAQSSLSKRSCLSSWFGYSSPNQPGGNTFELPCHHPEDDDNAGDKQLLTALSHPIEMEVDNLVAVLQRLSSEVVPHKPPSSSASAQRPSDAGATQVNDARVDVVDEKDKEKVEEKKKDPVFFKGVEFVDLDDCDVPDMRLQCDNKDTDDDNTQNLDDMDVGDGGASNLQCLEPSIGHVVESLQSLV